MTQKNEAAERLRKSVKFAISGMDRYWDSEDGDSGQLAEGMQKLRNTYSRDLNEALAAEFERGAMGGVNATHKSEVEIRRATVERIRTAVHQYMEEANAHGGGLQIDRDDLDTILDVEREEAAPSERSDR